MVTANELWTPNMAIGVDLIDAHHKALLDLLCSTKNAIEMKYDREYLKSIVSALVSYSKYHFMAEERLMLDNKYPDLERHRAEHKRFTEKINLAAATMGKDTDSFTLDLYVFLKDWFVNHILNVDKLIGPYIR